MSTSLRDIRRRHCLKLAVVADACGVKPSAVSKWEHGRVAIKLPELVRYLKCCGATESERLALLEDYAHPAPQAATTHEERPPIQRRTSPAPPRSARRGRAA